jgi:hypothetical protein
MASATLVESNIGLGWRLLKALDDDKFPVTAAFWYYLDDAEDWRLFIASPVVDQEGSRAAYDRILSTNRKVAHRRARVSMLSASEITAVGTRDPIVRSLTSAIIPGGTIPSQLNRTTITGAYMRGAYIYFIVPPTPKYAMDLHRVTPSDPESPLLA